MYLYITVPQNEDWTYWPQIRLASKSNADIRCLFKSKFKLDTESSLCLNTNIKNMYLNPSFLYYLSGGQGKTKTQANTSALYLLLCKYIYSR